MKFHIDDSKISINLQKISGGIEAWYIANKHYGYAIESEKGTVDFSPKSIPRLALKAALMPIALPMIRMLYKAKDKEPKPREKHEDLIDYFVLSFVRYIALFNEDTLYVKTVERPGTDERAIVTIATSPPTQAIGGPAEEPTEKTVEEGSPGGATYVRGGQNGYGENKVDKRNHRQESRSSALVKRL